MTSPVTLQPATGPPDPVPPHEPATADVARINVGGAEEGAADGTAVTGVDGFSRASLLQALARASSPAERIAGGWLRLTDDRTAAELRFARWSRRIADGRPDRIAEILAEHGFTLEQWRTGLGDVTVRPGQPLPRWVRDAVMLLDLVGTQPGPHRVPRLRAVAGDGLPDWIDGEQPWRFHPGFRDWLAVAAREVDAWAGAAPISDEARGDLVLDLARRQLGAAGPLLMQAAAARAADAPLFVADARGDWAALWTTHPVVARLLATVWRQWRETTAELCGRVTSDLPAIRPGVEVSRIELSAGDQHCDGRGVARLRLSDGTSAYLKPRSDRLHRLLGAVLARVDAAGPSLGIDPALSLPRIVEKDSYAWGLEVPAGDCASVDDYFRRTGALLRVLQAMGATDLHHENFVPTGSLPVLVDLETAISPGPLRSAPPDDAVAQRLSDTPGPTSMVTSVISGAPGFEAADIGALAGPSQARTPYPVRQLLQTAAGAELRSVRAPLQNGNALPRLAGTPVPLRGYEQALMDGYADAQSRLAALAAAPVDLLPEHIAAGELAPSVRFVARPTRTYARLLLQSTEPAALVDGVERELVIELLYRATGTAPAGLIACEAEAMRDLDVPLFTIPFDRPDLISDRGVILSDVLTQAPAARTRARLGAVAARDDHADDLLATVFAMDPDEREAAGSIRSAVAPREDVPVDCAEPVALLLDRAVQGRAGTLGWVGLEHDPNRNRWTYGRLSPGLTGQAGIGLALAMVAASAVAPVAGCATAARTALLDSVQRVGHGDRGAADAFGGPAGVLYAAAVAARLLGDTVLLDAARSLLLPCLRAARRDQPSIVIDGTAGAILALLQLPPDAATADAHTELLDLLQRSTAAVDLDPPDCWSRSLPSRAAGTALARHRLSRHRWADIRTPANDVFADPAGPPIAGHPGEQIAAAGLRPPDTPGTQVGDDSGLRTLLDQATLAQAALRAGGGPAWAARRERVVTLIVDRRRRTGRWAAPLLAPDSTLLSPVHGLAALAVLFTDSSPDAPTARTLT